MQRQDGMHAKDSATARSMLEEEGKKNFEHKPEEI